ncbi:MAG: hypothetical protein KGM24_04315 [Elusimicrobia bacterium]|nr:hypothetical protein [Elusimicrobiota bacterium]
MTPRAKRALRWALLAACFAADLVLASLRQDQLRWVGVIPQSGGFKLRHLIQYAPQGALAADCLSGLAWPPRAAAAILLVTLAAGMSEWRECYVPTRFGSWTDVLWGLAGAAIGVLAYRLRARRGGRR